MSGEKTPLHGISAGATHPGNVRQINEDAYLDRPDIGLWAVADGMGGHNAGDLASRTVIEALNTVPRHKFLGWMVAGLRASLEDANQYLCAEARRRGVDIIGSTIVVLAAAGDQCALLWVGDSRIYRLRNGTLRQLSHDHSQIQALIDEGLLTPNAAEEHPAANVVTRAVGAEETLEIDAQICEIKNGDRFLLCSDGLTKEIPESTIAELLAQTTLKEIPRTLIDETRKRGARDNVTLIAIDFLPQKAA